MAGPRQLWRTTIVVWTKDNPDKIDPRRLVGDLGTAVTKWESELVSDPYKQEDGPEEGFFEED